MENSSLFEVNEFSIFPRYVTKVVNINFHQIFFLNLNNSKFALVEGQATVFAAY